MVQVVGKDQSKVKRVTCNNCASVLEYVQSEVTESKSYDYTGSCDIIHTIQCPCCLKWIRVKGY